jgi:hypothetical protein
MKMKNTFLMWCWVIAAITILLAVRAEAQPPADSDAEAAIRKAAGEFTEAFDRGDAEALANHFTTDGVYVNEEGQTFEGRDAIQKEYEAPMLVHYGKDKTEQWALVRLKDHDDSQATPSGDDNSDDAQE